MIGYARIHRSLIGHPAFRNDAESMAFAWMILRASWKPERVRYKGKGIHLGRGQLAISQRDMAHDLDRDKAWVERLWKRLKAEAMIEVGSEAGVAVITICNYGQYQTNSEKLEAVGEALSEAFARQTQGTEQGREEGKKGKDEANASFGRIVSSWNEMCAKSGLSRVRSLGPARKQALRLRLKEHGEAVLLEAVGIVGRSPWLKGENRDGDWRPTIDFILQPSSLSKVLEGAYGGLEEKRTTTPAEQLESLRRVLPMYERDGHTAWAEQARQKIAELEREHPPDARVNRLVGQVASSMRG